MTGEGDGLILVTLSVFFPCRPFINPNSLLIVKGSKKGTRLVGVEDLGYSSPGEETHTHFTLCKPLFSLIYIFTELVETLIMGQFFIF